MLWNIIDRHPLTVIVSSGGDSAVWILHVAASL